MKALSLALLSATALVGLACSSVDMTGIPREVTGGGAGTATGGASGGTIGGTSGSSGGASGGTVGATGGSAGNAGGSSGSGGNTGGAGSGGAAGSSGGCQRWQLGRQRRQRRHGSDMASESPPADVPGTLLSNGAACGSAAECKSGFCADGVCCDTACQGSCQACVASKSAGVDGQCRAVPVGNDPDNECAADMANVCGRTGACSGMSSCALAPSGMACGDTKCTGSTLTPRPRCTGGGVCETRPVEPCAGNLLCANASTCRANCVSDGDCVNGTFCDMATGRCRSTKPPGAACDPSSAGSDCQSGNCVDGFCCDTACKSLCTACSNAKTGAANGKCAPVKAGIDPDNECATEATSTCGRDGTCDGSGACRLYADGTAVRDHLLRQRPGSRRPSLQLRLPARAMRHQQPDAPAERLRPADLLLPHRRPQRPGRLHRRRHLRRRLPGELRVVRA